ncbi:MAG: FeoA family protein, partial [Actinomycetes bacterium]
GRITRISDDDPDLLRYLAAEEIDLDAEVEVVGRRPFGGALVVRIRNSGRTRDYDLADEVTSALWVQSDHPHPGCVLGDARLPKAGTG